ncbi:cytochrome P450 [Gynuella sunshinyii]|uniref:Cytochrome P450 n=1 Tax=Gynuella sunshinyii YC6258 TaxID=1445510 RepID=A0A0C5VRF5_9GAMM|nr:cytochrome P450 [Gynuella sunshinyii]AJQ96826.1 cytochrome P450 [Gynuella sunshinyii YC6258]
MNIFLLTVTVAFVLSLPYWLPPLIIRLRMNVFTRINGEEALHLPSDSFNAEDFKTLYGNPALSGRSKGAELSDLFWYWLAPGPEVHPEHLELSDRYRNLSRFTRQLMARSRTELESMIDQYQQDPLRLSLHHKKNWTSIRLRDAFMPLWADFFYRLLFNEPCNEKTRNLIVNHASDVVNALKCCKLRNMSKRHQLTEFLVNKLESNEFPHPFPPGLTTLEQAHYLQGAFFNTAIVQMSEAMSHLIMVIAQHPHCQERLRSGDHDHYLDDVINESLRLNPLFGIAHRIVTDTVNFKGSTIKKGTVVCFNYPEFHKQGYENPDQFNPDRWQQCPAKDSNFMPFGITSNRSCPAQGLATVTMRRLAFHVINSYWFTSPVPHTRSLPNRGPCLVMLSQSVSGHRFIRHIILPLMLLRDHWEDLYRSLTQLVFGTIMILHAKKLKLCKKYFQQLESL